MNKLSLFCDGSCQMATRDGGWAYVVINKMGELAFEYFGNAKNTTNNAMELTALLNALKYAIVQDVELTIFTDSQYCSNGYNIWCKGWEKKGWKTSTNKKVENLELWQAIHAIRSSKITVEWVKAHNGNEWNEYVDSLTRFYG